MMDFIKKISECKQKGTGTGYYLKKKIKEDWVKYFKY